MADLAWLVTAAAGQGSAHPAPDSRYELPTGEPPYATSLGRLVECGALQIWFEDDRSHVTGRWVLEASRHNRRVAACFSNRTIGRRLD